MKSYSFIMLLFTVLLISGHTNPMRRPEKSDTITIATSCEHQSNKTNIKNELFRRLPFSNNIFAIQKSLMLKFTDYFRSIKDHPTFFNVFILLFITFIYGIIHSLGPGHAKLLFVSHSIAKVVSFKEIWISGILFSVTHAGVSLVLFLIIKLMLGVGQSTVESYSDKMVNISGYLVCFAGLIVIFAEQLEHIAHSMSLRFFLKVSGMKALAVSAGLAPCPGAFLILTFSSIIGMLYLGIVAVVTLSIGMALTVSTVGTITTIFRQTFNDKKESRIAMFFHAATRLLGGCLIILVGITMILH